MKTLVLNCGSSSIKFQLFRIEDWTVTAAGNVARIGEASSLLSCHWQDARDSARETVDDRPVPNHHIGLERIATLLQENGALGELRAIGHRVVHGGEAFQAPTPIDEDVIAAIRQTVPLAPLHNPPALDGILVARQLFPAVPQVAVFDTAFHQTMPRVAYRYALPEALYREHGIRRYGFHGTSHRYVGKRAAALLGKAFERCNLITLHLGNGASATAIRNGASIDTSMGMTPLEGLIMGTRCGDLDPAVPLYLSKHLGLDVAALETLLNRQSGLLGICGANDMREIHRLAENGDERAGLALEMFCYRLKKYVGAYSAALGEVDAVVFTGGIGENDADIRARVCQGLKRLGLALDPEANRGPARGERVISAADSPVRILVIPTDEELEIAQQTLEAIGETRLGA